MHLTIQQLSAHLDAALQGASRQLVNRHLTLCEECRDELAALTMQDDVLAGVLNVATHPELFDLIGLQVRSALDPNKAGSLEKKIAALEEVHAQFRSQTEEKLKRESEARRRAGLEDDLADLAAAAAPGPMADIAEAPPPTPPVQARIEAPAPTREEIDREKSAAGDRAESRARAQRRAIEEESARAREEARGRHGVGT